ncbi:MAG TPA: thioesterase domain-containing protein [Kofleriaceae bacterium]
MSDDAAKRKLFELLAAQARPVERDGANQAFAASLVRLYPHGTKRPFFCVHPGPGTVGCFAEVAPLVDPDRPFLALQAPGVDGECDPIEDLGTLAHGYVEEIRRVQPRGPYLIGGWSLGGAIAFQMAHELRRLGEEVALLVLFDVQRAEALHAANLTRDEALEITYRQFGLATAHLARQRGVEIDVDEVIARIRRDRARSMMSRLGVMTSILVERGLYPGETSPVLRVFRANLRALGDHAMPAEPYDGKLILFRARNEVLGPGFDRVDATYCWSQITTQPVEVVPIPGHHFAMFHGDVLPETARQLRRCLDAADRA